MLNKLLAQKKLIIFILIVIAGSGYFYYRHTQNTASATSYILSSAEKQTVIVNISGTGQVSSSDEVELQAKASGDLVYLNAVIGQKILKGALIAQLNASDALKTIRDAQANLESAQISLEKLTQPTDNLSLLQAENALEQAKQNKTATEDNIIKGYEDSFNDLSDTFLDLPDIMNGLYNILYSTDIGKTEVSVNGMINTSALLTSTYESQKNNISQLAKNENLSSTISFTMIGYGLRSANESLTAEQKKMLNGELFALTKKAESFTDQDPDIFIDQKDGQGICSGDSGGPGYVYDAQTDEFFVAGVLSGWAPSPAPQPIVVVNKNCTGIARYSNLMQNSIKEWILRTLAEWATH